MFRPLLVLVVSLAAGAAFAVAATHKPPVRSSSTAVNSEAYRGAIVIDAATGQVLFEDRADVQSPPASVTKLMTFLIVEEKIKRGELKLDAPVTVTAEASHTGGSRVWLVDKESITVEDLLYALMVQSANDAAVALADHICGSKEAFVDIMNIKARELGLHNTVYHSPHGLPPELRKGQESDLSTARDLAMLARKLIAETDVLKYSATRHRDFRHQNGKVISMDNHDHLLSAVPGCDGLKTGYYREAGYSIAATAMRGGRRVIAVVLGSPSGNGRQPWGLRDTVTTQLIERGFAALPPPVAAAAPVAQAPISGAAAPAAAAVTKPATPVPPAAATPDDANAPRLIPVESGEPAPAANPASPQEPSVHLDTSGKRK